MAIVKCIQPMNGHHKRNFQTLGEQRRRVAARQGCVSVDHIDRLDAVQPPYSPEQTAEEKLPCAGQAKISWELRVSHPISRGPRTRMFSGLVYGRYGNYATFDARPSKLIDGFRDIAPAHLILVRRKECSKRQNVQGRALSIIPKPVQDTLSIVAKCLLPVTCET